MCRKCGFGGDLHIASPDALLDGHRIAQILAAGDATSRASLLALHALGGEMGYPERKNLVLAIKPGYGPGASTAVERYWEPPKARALLDNLRV